MTEPPNFYAKVRAEILELLGWGKLDSLTTEQAMRADMCTALRLGLDDLQGRLARGEQADVAKLLSLSEALSRLLPPLREPPPQRDDPHDPNDWRERLWQMYKTARDRAAAHGLGYDGLQLTNEKLTAKVSELEAELSQLKGGAPPQASPPVPLPPNVAILPRPTANSAPVPDAEPPQPEPPARTPVWDNTPNGRAWNEWRAAGGYTGAPGSLGDRWSPPRDW